MALQSRLACCPYLITTTSEQPQTGMDHATIPMRDYPQMLAWQPFQLLKLLKQVCVCIDGTCAATWQSHQPTRRREGARHSGRVYRMILYRRAIMCMFCTERDRDCAYSDGSITSGKDT